ncbi:MAG: sensor histidine kinase [Ignavibacteriales bacterium]|nr:sensor histidine kinase [Ignavibacteriales bacterium]
MQIESQEAERKRLAAELHDGLGQNLLLASNELQQYLQQQDGSREGVQQAASLLQESIHSIREMASNLHPHQIERLGFRAALTAMTESIMHATGLAVKQRCDDIHGLLPKETEVQLYRIVQEALSNIVHHAGAKNVNIEIWKNPGRIEVTVADDGTGFNADEIRDHPLPRSADGSVRGFGLSSMAERARIIGGELKIESHPGEGTTVSVTCPYS